MFILGDCWRYLLFLFRGYDADVERCRRLEREARELYLRAKALAMQGD